MTMRISGLASGMDIDQIVSDLMKAERIPLDKMSQKKQTLEWQRDDYREMNKLLNDLDQNIFGGIFRQATYLQKTVMSSNESAVTVKNINATANLTTTISVSKLAQNAYMYSKASIGTAIDPNASLSSQQSKFTNQTGLVDGDTFTIAAIKADGTMGDPVSFTIDLDDSLNDVINRINNSEAGVVAFFDETTGKVSITAKNTGDNSTGSEIVLTGSFLTDTLQLHGDSDLAVAASVGRSGQNAELTINGLATSRPSNTFTINGFEYTLKAETTSDVTISSSTDVDSILEKIVKFVDLYNETIEKINGKLTEDRYRDFKPLTDEQKEAMEEKEIELWEEKAKSGMLRNDSILSSGLNQMRMDMYSRVDGVNTDYDQLSEIGITTSNNYLDRGKLIIDENKLKEAIQKDPNAIYQLFTADGGTFEEKGIARRLRDSIKDTINNVEARAGNKLKTNEQFTIGRNLDDIKDQIDAFQDRLVQIEDRYYRQFTAMEKAIQRANQQSMYLMQQFGG